MNPKTPKPPLPAAMFLDWPRIPVDTAENTPYAYINRIAGRAARNWALGPDGPYHREQPLAHVIDRAVSEALLHLMELGLIDVDTARINAAPGIPWTRHDFRPAPQHDDAGATPPPSPAPRTTPRMYNFCLLHPNAPVIASRCGGCSLPTTTAATEECPAGVHSIFDPCPGDCGKLIEDTVAPETPKPDSATYDGFVAALRLFVKVPSLFAGPPPRTTSRYDGPARRERYAATIRDEIKRLTLPAAFPGQRPWGGATEYDLADTVLAVRDDELTTARAQNAAVLRLAEVWTDAPDPLARAMAADLHSALRGAATEATEPPRLLDCGLCYEEHGQEAHPHPECTHDVTALRAERDRYATALDKVRTFNKLTAEGSCRTQAIEQARDTLSIIDTALNAPTGPPEGEKGQQP